jgi:hypothetical protein
MNRAGYAIEYDYYPPTQLDASLQVRAIPGLYFAGQINVRRGTRKPLARRCGWENASLDLKTNHRGARETSHRV